MKEATGELNMTVITVIAIAAIAGIFYAFVWPMIQTSIRNNTCSTFGNGWIASKSKVNESTGKTCAVSETDANGETWYCCPPNK